VCGKSEGKTVLRLNETMQGIVLIFSYDIFKMWITIKI
jgi:hypothetical protein